MCIWVERRLGDERQRMLAKRLVFALLVIAGFILAYDAATLPLGIETIWSRDLREEITHVSSFEDPDHGEVIAVALTQGSYGSRTSIIILLDKQGNKVKDLTNEVPTAVFDLLYLPTPNSPGMIIGLPNKYASKPSYIISPNLTRLETEYQSDKVYKTQGLFSPSCLDSWIMGDGRTLITGFSPNGPPYLVALTYSGHQGNDDLKALWVKGLPGDEVFAKIMNDPVGRDPVILVAESRDVIAVYGINGSRLWSLNFTEYLLSTGIYQENKEIRCYIQGDNSVFGREQVGLFFKAYPDGEDGWRPSKSFFAYLDSHLQVQKLWGEAPSLINPLYISSENKILTYDTCLDENGEIAWIRRGSWNKLAIDLLGNEGEEAVSVKPAIFRKRTIIHIFDADGSLVAQGSSPGEWGELEAADVTGDGEKEILYYTGTILHLLQINDTPYLPRLALEIALVSLVIILTMFLVRTNWPPESLKKLGSIFTLQSWKPEPPRAKNSFNQGRVVKHDEYRICECGGKNSINANTCMGCGKRLRQRRTEGIDLSAKGRLSKIGLASGFTGLLIYAATPAVWSVEPSGSIHTLVRSLFTVISPIVPYTTWTSLVIFFLSLTGVCLIYLERSALTGAVACLMALGISIYSSYSWMQFSMFPLVLIGICGLLQVSQRIVMTRRIRQGEVDM